jgi:DNA polymerase elongation subunit (family B)
MDKQQSFFPYSWYIDEKEKSTTNIRVYGLNNKNQSMCVKIYDFQPYIYIELPEDIDWSKYKVGLVVKKLQSLLKNKGSVIQSHELVYKKKLYYAHIDKDKNIKTFPYLYCKFNSVRDIKNLTYSVKDKIVVSDLGAIKVKIHEQDASPILQLCCVQNIPTAGWIKIYGKEASEADKETLCKHEYIVKSKNLCAIKDRNYVAKPKIMGFDIEVNSSNPSAMPKAEKSGDKVFQISCIFCIEGDDEKDYKKYLLSLGNPDPKTTGEDVNIYSYINEAELLEGFTDLILEENPNVIVGYNILGFDIPYMIARAKKEYIISSFDRQGFHKYNHASEKTIKWSSSAYKNQEFQFLDAEGRLFVDLMPLVKRDYKLDNYKLKTVSEYFLKDTKDDLSAKGIFKCYRIGMKGGEKGSKALAVCGKYCVQDSMLVVKLMEKLQIWVGLTEMACVCNVSPFALYTQGQQLKVFSQIYKYCFENNIVVEKDGYTVSDKERYVGAHVFDPIPGCYDRVVPFDFSSLYPTTIIAYNIDYSTLVLDPAIPDSECHVMDWEDHIGCQHDPKVIRKVELTKYIDGQKEEMTKLRALRDKSKKNKKYKEEIVTQIEKMTKDLKPYQEERSNLQKSKPKFPMCAERHYRFLKEPKGVLPTILQNLLDARKHTRNQMKDITKELKDCKDVNKMKELNLLYNVLDKRQLAYKVSANSAYGALGVRKGYLPFMPGAMCCCYMGRKNIELVAKTIPEKYGGELVYGD